MLLDDLVGVIRTLRERIQDHASELQRNELATRYTLVDPLLRALDWDTADLSQVQPEYSAGSRRVDYALLDSSPSPRPACLLEAKPLGGNLADALDQAGNYSLQIGVGFLALTDGRRWQIYDLNMVGKPLAERLVISFDLSTNAENEVAFKALFLWRGNLQAPVPSTAPMPVSNVNSSPPGLLAPEPPQVATPPFEPPLAPGEVSLEKLEATADKGQKPPSWIRFQDGTQSNTSRWNDVLKQTAAWLVSQGVLTIGKCPIMDASGKSWELVTTTKTTYARWEVAPSIFVNVNYNAPNCVRQAVHLLRHFGHDPSKVTVSP